MLGVSSPAERLRELLDAPEPLLVAELECPRSGSAANVGRQARAYAPHVTAVACTDNSAAVARMDPLVAATIAARAGALPLVYLTCRSRNRLALRSSLLGAVAAGAAGVVCTTGDDPAGGDQPGATDVSDLDVFELLHLAGTVRGGQFGGEGPPDLVPGCVVQPEDGERAIERLARKAEAGAVFALTQMVLDTDAFARWMEGVRAAGLHERLRVLAGVAPVRRPGVLRFLREQVGGLTVPEWFGHELEAAPDWEEAAVHLAGRTLRAVLAVPGVGGAYLMTFGWAEGVGRVVRAAGR